MALRHKTTFPTQDGVDSRKSICVAGIGVKDQEIICCAVSRRSCLGVCVTNGDLGHCFKDAHVLAIRAVGDSSIPYYEQRRLQRLEGCLVTHKSRLGQISHSPFMLRAWASTFVQAKEAVSASRDKRLNMWSHQQISNVISLPLCCDQLGIGIFKRICNQKPSETREQFTVYRASTAIISSAHCLQFSPSASRDPSQSSAVSL